MNRFRIGGIVYHKASNEKGVVVSINSDGTVKVKTSFDGERDCLPDELKTEEEVEAHFADLTRRANQANENRFEAWSI